MKKNHALIVANAPRESGVELPDSILASDPLIVALDGAMDGWPRSYPFPNIWLGDFDSCQNVNAHPVAEKIIAKDQFKTDLDKGIEYCLSQGIRDIQIIHATGGRLDHTLLNIRLLRKHFNPAIQLKIWDGCWEIIFGVDGEYILSGVAGDQCAVMGAPKGKILKSSGLCWEIASQTPYPLDFGLSESACNQLSGASASVWIEGEVLLMAPKVRRQSA